MGNLETMLIKYNDATYYYLCGILLINILKTITMFT